QSDIYQQIGDAFRTQGLYVDAERNLRAALRLRLDLYGEDNAKVAESMYILSGVRDKQGDVAEQERLVTQALNIQRRHPNDTNNLPYMLVDYANLLIECKGDYQGALAQSLEALEIFRGRYGENHYMVGASYEQLAGTYLSLGDYARAESAAHESMRRGQQGRFGAMLSLASILILKSDYQQAGDLIGQMLRQAKSSDVKPSWTRYVYVYSLQSSLAFHQGNYAQ